MPNKSTMVSDRDHGEFVPNDRHHGLVPLSPCVCFCSAARITIGLRPHLALRNPVAHLELFFRTVEMNGDVFMVAPPDEVNAERVALCRAQMMPQACAKEWG